MKSNEELVSMMEIILMQEKSEHRAYENGRVSFKDYQRDRRDLKNKLEILLWVYGFTRCYFTPNTIQEVFDKASYVVALYRDESDDREQLPNF